MKAQNLIVALRTFILGEAAFEDSEDVCSQDVGVQARASQRPVPFPQRKRTSKQKHWVQKKPIKKKQVALLVEIVMKSRGKILSLQVESFG